MESNLDRYKQELNRLIEMANEMLSDLAKGVKAQKARSSESGTGIFFSKYQNWYTEAQEVVKQLIPSRGEEFCSLYKIDGRRKTMNQGSYCIQDWLLGARAGEKYDGEKYFDDLGVVAMKFQSQLYILKSAQLKFSSNLLNIKQLLQADLFDSEIEIAKELSKKGFVRAAGAIAGVILERHLNATCQRHSVAVGKKATINILNTALKESEVIEIHQWRFMQQLADLRNLCDHDKDREPTPDEIGELIKGVDKITKTVF